MTDVLQTRLDDEYAKAIDAITAADLAPLIPHIERYGLGGDLDLVVRTARPNAKVQRRFLPAHVQGDILKAALRNAKAQDLVQNVLVGFYAEELGDDVENPSLDQLRDTSATVLARSSRPLVMLTLLGVVDRGEVAAEHAVTVLRESFDCDLTK